MKKLILLTGPALCGKDSSANALVQEFGFKQMALADPIRAALKAAGLVDDRDLLRENKEKDIPWLGVSARRLMQTLGTEWGRETIHPDIWIKILAGKIACHDGDNVVVTDVRFDNEVDKLRYVFCKEAGWATSLWRIVRPGQRFVQAHSSETGVMYEPIVTIYNSADLEDLYSKVTRAAQFIYPSLQTVPL